MSRELSEERFRNWMRSLLRKLLMNFTTYFSKDCVLNSDGRKLLEEVARNTIRRYPMFKKVVNKVRKDPSLENVVRLARIYMCEDEINELLTQMHASLRHYLGLSK